MRRDKWYCRPCDKSAFPSESRAESAIEYIQTQNNTGHVPVRAYECPYDNGWHLTSKERKTA